ncbi:MAG: preprotein translocase subunit YajC [Calditrichae bacterium]|nr:preprotein translocase subunit YajC [Calditrichia bacterium]NOQ96531.1 preprotein translocase subunit YajC [Calditrichia bacterium]
MGGGGGAEGGSAFLSFLPLILIVVVMYLLILRPQAKKQKDRQKMLDTVKKGDEVVTVGGVHGKVVGLKNDDKVLVVKVDDNVKLDIDRSAISGITRST